MHTFKQYPLIILFSLLAILCLNSCDSYESQVNAAMYYDSENKATLALPFLKAHDGSYSAPRYIEVKYIDQKRVMKALDIERRLDLVDYLKNIESSDRVTILEELNKAPLKKEGENEGDYSNRILGLIPDLKMSQKAERIQADIRRDVWDLFRIAEIDKSVENKDLLFWVIYRGMNFNSSNQIDFLILSQGNEQKLEKVLIKTVEVDNLDIGFESTTLNYKKQFLYICKNFKPEARKKYTLEIKGKYIAKKVSLSHKIRPEIEI